eukprot:TRINITY_DN1627_c0_g2_i1.p1 TRINITY_DN1627_c0_g2~~TRINITY_DN1627_c0_g2_i1.p1  ORF type:complete len:779 (+),score=145.57 TRINITY_DN1627_c0_g2_i1:43-2379(+)
MGNTSSSSFSGRPRGPGLSRVSDSPRVSNVDFYESADMPYNIESRSSDYVSTPAQKLKILCWEVRFPQNFLMLIFLITLGCTTAGIALVMNLLIDNINLLKFMASSSTTFFFVNYLIWIVLSVAFAIVAASFVHFVSVNAAGSGIPEMKSILSGTALPRFLAFRTLIAKFFSLTFSIVAGLSVGKEGPMVHLASATARNLCRIKPFRGLWQNEMLRQQVLAAACAAGVSATFGTPVGGVLFSIEVTSTYYLVQNYWKGFFCAVCGALLVHLIGGTSELKLFTTNFSPQPYDYLELFAYCLLGVISGLIGALWVETLKYISFLRANVKIFQPHHYRYAQVILVTVVTALAAYPFELLRAGQKAAINKLFSDAEGMQAWNWDPTTAYLSVLVFVIFKFFFTAISVGLPIGAGIFTPIFALGAGVGRLIGEIMHSIFGSRIIPGGYAVVGAAAVASGVTRTFSTAVIVFELTGQLNHMLPVLCAVLLAYGVANRFNEGVFDTILHMKKLPYLPALKAGLYGKLAQDIMHAPDVYVPQSVSFTELFGVLQRHTAVDAPVPVVLNHESMELIGVVQRGHLEKLLDRLGYSSERYMVGNGPMAERSFALSSEPPPTTVITIRSVERDGADTEPAEQFNTPLATQLASIRQSISDDAALDSGAGDDGIEHSDTERLNIASSTSFEPPSSASPAVPSALHQRTKPMFRSADGTGVIADADFLDKPIDLLNSIPIERAPMQLSNLTPVPRLHLLFVMLGLKQVLIIDSGKLVGSVGRADLMEGNAQT